MPVLKKIVVIMLVSAGCILAAAQPRYVAELPNIHEYDLFANNGWTGNWYVGYDHAWIVKLPPVTDRDNFRRAFLGVKLGREKTAKQIIKILEKTISDGRKKLDGASGADRKKIMQDIETAKNRKKYAGDIKIYIAISQTPDFSKAKAYVAAFGGEIPLEGDYSEALNHVSSSKWFWAETPLDSVSSVKDNYVAVWSDNPLLTSAEYAPVIAAGWSDDNKNAYLTTTSKGAAPARLEKNISYFTPALCIKLIPANSGKIFVSVKEAKVEKGVLRVAAGIEGNPERVALRLYRGSERIPTGYGAVTPPWRLTARDLSRGRYKFYIEATDYFENSAKTKEKTFVVE